MTCHDQPGEANTCRVWWISFSLLLCLCGCQPALDSSSTALWDERVRNADAEPHNWLAHGRTYSEQRFSPLGKIDSGNVHELGLAWSLDLGTDRGLEATPIVVDGIMYVVAAWNIVVAIDGLSGRELWRFDPQVSRAHVAAYSCCDAVSRGVAVWDDLLIFATLDGRLVALDRFSGALRWSVLTVDPDKPYTITGAPRVVKGKVVIGNSGADYGVRGYVSAYEAASGDLVWRFYTVPGNPAQPQESAALEMALATWSGDEWQRTGGGGTVWNSFAFDPQLNLLYFGVGNGTPWSRELRSPGGGDNLFLSSIVAVNADTGDYAWHYQTTPGESWNYSAVESIVLADLEIRGELRTVLIQAPKNGFFYVLDRTSGELLAAEKYVPLTWASHVDSETGRPVEYPYARYQKEGRLIVPGPSGGHSWHPMSFSPETGFAYIPALSVPGYYRQDGTYSYKSDFQNTGIEEGVMDFRAKDPQDKRARFKFGVYLLAWDPVEQKERWRVEHSDLGGGTLATAGNLVFQGLGTGDFVAYSADLGEEKWRYAAGTTIMAGPVTYAIAGEQFIAVLAGRGGGSGLVGGPLARRWQTVVNENRVLAFRLRGNAKLPGPRQRDLNPIIPEVAAASIRNAGEVQAGKKLYEQYCYMCHGLEAISGGVIPDLRYASEASYADWITIVIGGSRTDSGMRSFAQVLNTEQALAIRSYVVERAMQSRK